VSELTTTAADSVALANRLRPVLLRLNRELRREIHSLGINGGQASLLIQIKSRPGVGVRELAALERVSAPAMSKSIDRLERAGLVARVRATDRRRVGIEVSAEGERVLLSVRRRRTAWLATRLEGLSPVELDAVDRAIEPLSRLFEVDA
jgi:DNA-binding MarR family transcriptional regulator